MTFSFQDVKKGLRWTRHRRPPPSGRTVERRLAGPPRGALRAQLVPGTRHPGQLPRT